MNEKKIEPTDAMVRDVESWSGIIGVDDLDLLRYVLNHPDTPGLFTDEDARPWEPLGTGDPVYVGDEVRQDWYGTTTIAIVGRVDGEGDPWTTEGYFIGRLDTGTWYVRRPAQDLPPEPGAVIVPADGREYIEARVYNKTYRAREAMRHWAGGWHAAWRSGSELRGVVGSEEITPGTWKVEGE